MRLIDPHAHLNADRFAHDVELVVGAAKLAGIERMLIPGWNVASSERALELAERWPWLDASVGIHPHDAAKVDDAGWARIERWAADERVSAIGETGLDSRTGCSRPGTRSSRTCAGTSPSRARRGSRRSSTAARRTAAAMPRMRWWKRWTGPGWAPERRRSAIARRRVIHSFSGPLDYARAMLDRGLTISFSGLVFRRGEEASGQVAPLVPSDRLLVETDSPFLTPPGGPKGRNEPSAVAITASWLAERRGEASDALGARLVEAYDRTFPRERPR